jgi:hypothetical protein
MARSEVAQSGIVCTLTGDRLLSVCCKVQRHHLRIQGWKVVQTGPGPAKYLEQRFHSQRSLQPRLLAGLHRWRLILG